MPGGLPFIAAVALVAILVAVSWWYARRSRSGALRNRFGPEYERTVAAKGGTRDAEAELKARQKRVAQLEIRPLAADERQRFSNEWRAVQAQFVDDPAVAVLEADALIGRAMEARGYPVSDFEQRAADMSVDHPTVLEHYRAAHDVALRQADGQASTEDLRRAMVDYRTLFAELLGETRTVESRPGTPAEAPM